HLQTFTTLLSALPSSTLVFILLDGITYYESLSKHRDDLDFFMKALAELVGHQRQKDGCGIKLMVMSPWNSHWLWKAVKEVDNQVEVVWVPSKVPSVGGFTAMKWQASVEKT